MTAQEKGKYTVRWQIEGTALDVEGKRVNLGKIKGRFILKLD